MDNGNTISGFEGWDDVGLMEDLFQEGEKTPENPLDEALQDDPIPSEDEPEKTPEEKKAPVKKEEDFFAQVEEIPEDSEEDEDPEEIEKPVTPEKVSSMALLSSLKERGLVEYEIDEGEEMTEELAEEILEDSYEQRMESFLEEKLTQLDPAVREIVKYNINGGNFRDLLGKMVPTKGVTVTEDMDLAEEENQIALVTRDRREKGESQEDIDTYVEYLKDAGKLESISKKLHKAFVQKDANLAKEEADRVAQMRKQARERERAYRGEISSFMTETKEFDGIKLTAKEIRELPAYIAEASVELEGGRKISPLHRDIIDAMKDNKKVVLLAKIIRDGFKFDQFNRAEKTRVLKEVKDTIQGKTAIKKPRTLADYF